MGERKKNWTRLQKGKKAGEYKEKGINERHLKNKEDISPRVLKNAVLPVKELVAERGPRKDVSVVGWGGG